MVKRGFWTPALPLPPNGEALAMAPVANPPCRPPPLHRGPAAGMEDDADDAQKPNERLFKIVEGKNVLPRFTDDVPAVGRMPTLPPDGPITTAFEG